MNLFPQPEFSTTELHELATQINHPTVQKYLRGLAMEAAKDIVHGQRKAGESAESFLERLAAVRGGLAAVEVLLSIEKPAVAA